MTGSKIRVFLLFLASVLAAQTTHEMRPAPGNRFILEVFKSGLWERQESHICIDRFSGVLTFNHEQPEKSTVRFVVEAASARCVDDWVKPNQIKDIEKAAVQETMPASTFPEITFLSTMIMEKSGDQFEVQGLLTIRGRTKQVTVMVKTTPRGGAIWVEGSGRIRLSDFGLRPPRGIVGVGLLIGTKDEMTVQFGLLANSL